MFFYLCKVLFSGFLQFKGDFVRGQNKWKYHDWALLKSFNSKKKSYQWAVYSHWSMLTYQNYREVFTKLLDLLWKLLNKLSSDSSAGHPEFLPELLYKWSCQIYVAKVKQCFVSIHVLSARHVVERLLVILHIFSHLSIDYLHFRYACLARVICV